MRRGANFLNNFSDKLTLTPSFSSIFYILFVALGTAFPRDLKKLVKKLCAGTTSPLYQDVRIIVYN